MVEVQLPSPKFDAAVVSSHQLEVLRHPGMEIRHNGQMVGRKNNCVDPRIGGGPNKLLAAQIAAMDAGEGCVDKSRRRIAICESGGELPISDNPLAFCRHVPDVGCDLLH